RGLPPPQVQGAVLSRLDAGSEPAAFAVEHVAEPVGLGLGSAP
ncbi:hypothetical protein LCGC14_2857780, partial [marine sediment metagenome]